MRHLAPFIALTLAACATRPPLYTSTDQLLAFKADASSLACAIRANRFTADPDETFDVLRVDEAGVVLDVPAKGARTVPLNRLKFCLAVPSFDRVPPSSGQAVG